MALQLINIFKEYINGPLTTRVLRGISLEINDGEFVALIGPSGSGKSTTMNIIGCLDRPSGGKYLLQGMDTSKMSDNQLARLRNRHIGFVFQSFNLLSQYTAVENVEMPALYAGITRGKARKQACELLAALGMKERISYYPTQLSGGQKQRVAIARALVNRPLLLLADEPTGNLDSATGQDVLGIFKRLNEEGHTVLVITHDPEIACHAPRVVSILDGQIGGINP